MNHKFETLQLHAGQPKDTFTGARAVPIYQTASYTFKDTDHGARLFNLEEAGNIYTRIGNPTNAVLEERMSALEGGVGGLAVSSGASAIVYALLTIAKVGDEIVAAKNIYGGSYNFLSNTINDFGITTKFFETSDLITLEKAITSKTKVIFIESLGNPTGEIVDIEAISKIAKSHNLPLVVDNTFATPYLIKPIEYGANIVVHSATKFLGGHGTTIAGVIIDGGNFNWKDKKFETFNTPDPGYNNLTYSDLEEQAFIVKARVRLLRDTGAALSPFNAFLILQGIETLSLRVERHVSNAKKIAVFLKEHKDISWISHPEFTTIDQKRLAEKYYKNGVGSIFTFGLKGGIDRAKKFIENLEIFSHLANVADAKSLIIHPATTTHSQLNEEQLLKAGIKPETVRISVGLENIDDLIGDLTRGIQNSRSKI